MKRGNSELVFFSVLILLFFLQLLLLSSDAININGFQDFILL